MTGYLRLLGKLPQFFERAGNSHAVPGHNHGALGLVYQLGGFTDHAAVARPRRLVAPELDRLRDRFVRFVQENVLRHVDQHRTGTAGPG